MYNPEMPRRRPKNVVKAETVTASIDDWAWETLDDDEDDGDFVELADLLGGGASPLPGGLGGDLSASQPRRSAGYGIDQIKSEAEAIIREAEAERDRILTEAQMRAEQASERMYQEALAQAREELAGQAPAVDPGQEQAAEDLRLAAQALHQAAEQVVAITEARLDEMEAPLLEFAFEIAAKVIATELETNPEQVTAAVREGLERIGAGDVVVRLHPEDMIYVQQALIELQTGRPAGGMISFDEDPTIERGGCIVQADSGSIDAQPSTKLEQLRNLAE